MRDKKMVFLFTLFSCLFIFPTTLFAQADLTQTFTSDDGKFSINYPAGWKVTVDPDGLIRFNGNEGFVQISFYDNNNSGYAPVTAMELLEVGIGKGPQRMLGFSEPEKVVIAGYPTVVSHSDSVDQINTVMDFGDGILGQVYGYGPVATLDPIVKGMMESIQYGDGPKPIVKSSLDDVKAITPENADSVAQLLMIGDETVAVESVAFSPDGKLLAIGTADGSVELWDVATRESRLVLKGHSGGATSVAFGSGGYSIAVGTGSGDVRLWDVTSGDALGSLQKHDTRVASVAFTNEFLVASGAEDGSVKVWDIVAGSEQATLVDSNSGTPVGSVAFSPDGTMLAVGAGKTIQLWDTATATSHASLETEISEISSVSFSPDGTKLVYGGANPTAWIWDLKDDNHAFLDGHDTQVSAVAFSPDGQVIASGDAGMLRLWDASDGKNLAALTSQAVNTAAFNPDGTLIASAGATGGVVLWGSSGEGDASQAASAPENTSGSSGDATTEETTTAASASTCSITAPKNANLRSGPGTEFDRAGTLTGGQTAEVNGQAQGSDGMAWYRLADGAWVRSDVIGSPAECANVPVVTP